MLIARCDSALVGGAAVTGGWALGQVDGGGVAGAAGDGHGSEHERGDARTGRIATFP